MGVIPGAQVYPKDPRRQPDPQSIDLSQLPSGLFPNQVSYNTTMDMQTIHGQLLYKIVFWTMDLLTSKI